MRPATWVAEHGIDAPGRSAPAVTCCFRRPPWPGAADRRRPRGALGARARPVEGAGSQRPADPGPAWRRQDLCARTITSLVAKARKVGIAALSDKVIRYLLDEVVKAAEEECMPLRCTKVNGCVGRGALTPSWRPRTMGETLNALRSGAAQVAAGTAWLWARTGVSRGGGRAVRRRGRAAHLADVLAVFSRPRRASSAGRSAAVGSPAGQPSRRDRCLGARAHPGDTRPCLRIRACSRPDLAIHPKSATSP